MKKLASATIAVLISVVALAGTADAATRYRNNTNANAAGPMEHRSGMMGRRHMMRHHRMMHHKM